MELNLDYCRIYHPGQLESTIQCFYFPFALPVQRPVLNRLANVGGGYARALFKISDGAGHI